MWWPNLDQQIELITKKCQPCQEDRKEPASIRHSRWIIPDQIWTRVEKDLSGAIQEKMLLILMDATSKWPEVITMDSTSTDAIIFLWSGFARFSNPRELVSDNGPQITKKWWSPPLIRHPALVRRTVKQCKPHCWFSRRYQFRFQNRFLNRPPFQLLFRSSLTFRRPHA